MHIFIMCICLVICFFYVIQQYIGIIIIFYY